MLPRYVQPTPWNAAAHAAYTAAMYDNAKQPQKASVALFHTSVQREPVSYSHGLPDAAIHPSLQDSDDGERAEVPQGIPEAHVKQPEKMIDEDGDEQSMSLLMFFQGALLHEYLVFWA